MTPHIYVTDHQHSRVVGQAFAQGCDGKIAPTDKLLEGPAVVYGILRGCDRIIRECEIVSRDFYHIDHGYFDRGHYDGYYRVSQNAFQYLGGIDERDSGRFEVLKTELRPWKRSGFDIVICPFSEAFGHFWGIDPKEWTEAVIRELALHTERPITVKSKNGVPLFDALKDAWCLVTHSSNAAVDAIMAGIPAIVLGPSAAAPVAWRFEDIENPIWPDREPWAWSLAHHQFTLNEMRDGTAWREVSNGQII